MARLADKIVCRSSSISNIRNGIDWTSVKASKVGWIVILSRITACFKGKKEHFDDDFIHGVIFAIVLTNKTDVRRLNVEISCI